MKTLLCGIGRNENQYIREWVEYYKALGFSNICLFDNNYGDEEHFEEVIGDYIESGYVFLKDYRDKKVCQTESYQECYREYCKKYDWIAFFDIDEFLTFTNVKTIEEYFSKPIFKDYKNILVNVAYYSDANLVHNDKRPLLERFGEAIVAKDTYATYSKIGENCLCKSIIRGKIKEFVWDGGKPNFPFSLTGNSCNNSGVKVTCIEGYEPINGITPEFSEAYLKHFSTKTAEEYCQKLKRGFPDQIWDERLNKFLIEARFFRFNKITQEKIDIFKKELGIDVSYLLEQEKSGYICTKKKEETKEEKAYNIVCNNCIGGFLYKECLNTKYYSPFIYDLIKSTDFAYLIEHYDEINFNNVKYFQHMQLLLPFMGSSLLLDGKIFVYFPHHIKLPQYTEMLVKGSEKFYNKMDEYLIEKWIERVKRVKEPPVFIFHAQEYDRDDEILRVINAKTKYKKILIVNDEKYKQYETDTVRIFVFRRSDYKGSEFEKDIAKAILPIIKGEK